MEATDKKQVIQLGVEYLKSRALDSVIRTHGKLIPRSEITKQWNEANKEKK